MQKQAKAVLGIDIGGSKLVTGLVDAGGTVLAKEKHRWEKLDRESVLGTILEASTQLMQNNPGIPADAIGVNIPGLADPNKGLWVEACFSGIRDVPIGEILSDRFKLPARIDNDVNNCALGEKLFGICRDCTDFMWQTVSNGCGGALFLSGQVYRGAYFNAGEFGHICVEEHGGYPCGCGNHGCLDAQAAGPGIQRRYLEQGGSKEIDGGEPDARAIAELARKGDPLAIEIFNQEGYYIGKAMAAVINAVNPQKAIIGGGISGAFDLFYPELLRTVNRMTYREASKHVTIEKTGLGYDAALIGAAALAIQYIT